MKESVRERREQRAEPTAPTLVEATPVDTVLAMQRTAGNASVTAWLARDPAPAAAAPTLPTADVLTSRISNCVGVWETNRGGDAPAPTESSLDTLATVKASMATIEQATMPYALDALRKHASLRKLASPELTKEEINDAIARTTAVKTLLDAVKTAADAGTSADDFIKAQQGTITPSGLSDDNVSTMFSGVELKKTIDEKHGHVGEGKGKDKKTGKSLAGEIPRGRPARARHRLAQRLHQGPEEVGREPRRVAAAGGRQHARRRRRRGSTPSRPPAAAPRSPARSSARASTPSWPRIRSPPRSSWSRPSGPRTTRTRPATATTSGPPTSGCTPSGSRRRARRPSRRRSPTRGRS